MLIQIADFVDSPTLDAICDILKDDHLWSDGSSTAKGRACEVKNNLQAVRSNSLIRGLERKITDLLLSHNIVAALAPDQVIRVLFSKYQTGMAYGSHVDAAYIDGARADLSFTLFLSDPHSYKGGELVIETSGAEDAVKLPAGSIILYPSTSVHEVCPVEDGERIAAIGWIKSRIKSGDHRAMLLEASKIQADLTTLNAPNDLKDRMANLRNNMIRTFGD